MLPECTGRVTTVWTPQACEMGLQATLLNWVEVSSLAVVCCEAGLCMPGEPWRCHASLETDVPLPLHWPVSIRPRHAAETCAAMFMFPWEHVCPVDGKLATPKGAEHDSRCVFVQTLLCVASPGAAGQQAGQRRHNKYRYYLLTQLGSHAHTQPCLPCGVQHIEGLAAGSASHSRFALLRSPRNSCCRSASWR